MSKQSVRFCVFADFHYFRPAYPVTQAHLDAILRRAAEAKVDFVVQLGDFCNDFIAAPEITRYYTENPYGLPAYGVYGGHDLEYVEFSGKNLSRDNTMARVTPYLNNCEVVWGTADGTIGDGRVGYYYFDQGGFRFIAVDSQYSLNPNTGNWEKNVTYHAPSGNQRSDRLGATQLRWLENVLTDAAHCGLPCVIFGHSPAWHGYGLGEEPEVAALFERVNAVRKGTVMLNLTGHLHTNRPMILRDNVLYMDVNAAINAFWMGSKAKPHYGPEHVFEYVDYDTDGQPIGTYQRPYIDLWQGQNTWFVKEPLSAIVTVDTDGRVTVDGCETDWVYGIAPEKPEDRFFAGEFAFAAPRITSGEYRIER